MKLKELKYTFTKRGYTYTQMIKTPDVVLYQVRDENDGETYYEIFKYKTQTLYPSFATQKYIDDGYTDIEVYPSTECFGAWAWCCRNSDAVKRVLERQFEGIEIDCPNLI